jgi:signal transduction histidine kinase
MASFRRTRRLPSRTAVVAGLLVLTLGLVGVLAYQAVDATRSHRQVAEQTLKEHALFAAWELSSAIRREVYMQILAPGIEVVAKAGGVFPGGPMKDLDLVRKLSEGAGWWPAEEDLDYVFRFPLKTGPFQHAGDVSPDPATEGWIIDLLKAQAAPTEAGVKRPFWSMVFHGSGDQERILVLAVDPGSAEGQQLLAAVSLRPEAAESLLIGGLPGSRLPTILGLLVLASGLVIAALLQIRREQELSLLRTDFVSSVSHQLRTPLAQIRMFGETLLLGRVRTEEERERSLEIIVKESQRLTHQVDNVLVFSRAQRQDVQLNPQKVVLAPLVRETLESFCPVAEAQDCRVEASLDEDVAAVADPEAVKQILLNLLENAVKYGPRDQIVDVKLRRGSSETVRLEVEDEGNGIPADQREAVFSPYARLERDRDSGVAGSGIGLAVVRELVQRQGGAVWVEEAMSEGARFVVELPEASPPGPQRPETMTPGPGAGNSAPTPASDGD